MGNSASGLGHGHISVERESLNTNVSANLASSDYNFGLKELYKPNDPTVE